MYTFNLWPLDRFDACKYAGSSQDQSAICAGACPTGLILLGMFPRIRAPCLSSRQQHLGGGPAWEASTLRLWPCLNEART